MTGINQSYYTINHFIARWSLFLLAYLKLVQLLLFIDAEFRATTLNKGGFVTMTLTKRLFCLFLR